MNRRVNLFEGPSIRTIGEIDYVPEAVNIPATVVFLATDGKLIVMPVGRSKFTKAGIDLKAGTQFSAEATAGLTTPWDLEPRDFAPIEQLDDPTLQPSVS